MLKSLLGYQSGQGGGPTDSVIRKKVYQSAIDITLKNNFPLVLKVCVMVEKKESSVGLLKLYLLTFSCFRQLVAELVAKWKSYPEAQHTPLCAHQLVLAMKTITQLALGESCGDDARVISFRKNHDAVSLPGFFDVLVQSFVV